jgi:hypothetical protein
MKITGSGSESVSQRYGSADPDLYQNVTDPRHWKGAYMTNTFIYSNKTTRQKNKSKIKT